MAINKEMSAHYSVMKSTNVHWSNLVVVSLYHEKAFNGNGHKLSIKNGIFLS